MIQQDGSPPRFVLSAYDYSLLLVVLCKYYASSVRVSALGSPLSARRAILQISKPQVSMASLQSRRRQDPRASPRIVSAKLRVQRMFGFVLLVVHHIFGVC